MRRHVPPCPVWLPFDDLALPCRCPPPPWRIRKNAAAGDRHPWRVERLITDGTYELFLRANTFDKAVALVSSITTLQHRPHQ